MRDSHIIHESRMNRARVVHEGPRESRSRRCRWRRIGRTPLVKPPSIVAFRNAGHTDQQQPHGRRHEWMAVNQ